MIKFKIGQSVRVRQGIKVDGDCVGGWQGRVAEIEEDDVHARLITIAWDSVTLRALSPSYIDQCEEDCLSWSEINLEPEELEPVEPRDTIKDVVEVVHELSRKHYWSSFGAAGKRICRVLGGVDQESWESVISAWQCHLNKVLVFPFEAEVAEFQERGRLRRGDRLLVLGMVGVTDPYGLVCEVQAGRRKRGFPLCDLDVCNKSSPNYLPVQDYCTWFTNRPS